MKQRRPLNERKDKSLASIELIALILRVNVYTKLPSNDNYSWLYSVKYGFTAKMSTLSIEAVPHQLNLFHFPQRELGQLLHVVA